MTLFSKAIFNDEPAKGWLSWGLLAPILAFFLLALPHAASKTFILEPLDIFKIINDEPVPDGPLAMFAFLVLPFSIVALTFWNWIRFVEKRSLESVGLIKGNHFKTFMGGHAVGIVLMLVIIGGITVFGGYDIGSVAPAMSSPLALFYILLLMAGFMVQSSVEEFIFRGWLLSVLTRKFNLLTAILVSSILFMLMHFDPSNPFLDNLMTILFSFFACAWVIKTGNIWGVMGWHAGWNWITATGFELPVTGLVTDTPALLVQLTPVGSDMLTGGEMGPEGSVVTSVILALATLWMWRSPKSAAPPGSSEL